MKGLPEIDPWFDHDHGRVWSVQKIGRQACNEGKTAITIGYANGEEMGCEVLSPLEWAPRIADGSLRADWFGQGGERQQMNGWRICGQWAC